MCCLSKASSHFVVFVCIFSRLVDPIRSLNLSNGIPPLTTLFYKYV